MLAVSVGTLLAAPAMAQDGPLGLRSPVLTINYDRFVAGSKKGRTLAAELEAERILLEAENDRIASDLEAEELELTKRRDGMDPAAFRAAARAFDEKVQAIRAERRQADLDLSQRRDALRIEFDKAALPVLSDIMRETGAVVVLETRSVVLSIDAVEITELAIARLDQAVTAGEVPAPDAPQPAPDAPVQE